MEACMKAAIFLKKIFFVFILCVSFVEAEGNEKFNAQVEDLYRNFRNDPREVLKNLPPRDYSRALEYKKYLDSLGKDTIRILQESSYKASDWSRKKIVTDEGQLLGSNKRPWTKNDRPELLISDPSSVEKNISKLPQAARLKEIPWSSYYWALKYGSSAFRYSEAVTFQTWKDFFNSYVQPGEFNKLEKPIKNSVEIDFYSPAEKYDILVGDKNFTLTDTLRRQGASFVDKVSWQFDDNKKIIGVQNTEGDVELWMGICHGWAVSAYKAPRPVRGIELESVDGDKIFFHEDDLKSLGVLKYAQSKTPSRFMGGRCNIKESEVRKDETTGAVLDDDCFDTNPGAFHIVAMNKLSHNESFVIDATYDYEVWNQPVVSAEITYFNPQLGKVVKSLEEALAPYGFEGDIFHEMRELKRLKLNRSTKVKKLKKVKPKKIVGVGMKLTYVVETQPKQGPSLPDEIVEVTYVYDLELDKSGNIVGGEWYSNKHPDFVWDSTLDFNVWPENGIDAYLSKQKLVYDGSSASLKKILEVGVESEEGGVINVAQLSSSPQKSSFGLGDESPLAVILKYLFDQASARQ